MSMRSSRGSVRGGSRGSVQWGIASVPVVLDVSAAFAQGRGKPMSEADVAAWDISILPDGTGLPPGSGTPAQGVPVYVQK
jgi:hypothetical protein